MKQRFKALILLAMIANCVFAREEFITFTSPTGQASQWVGVTKTVDINSKIGAYKSKIFQYQSLNGVLKFGINNSSNRFYSNQTFTATLTVDIESWDINGTKLPDVNNLDLIVDYDHTNMARNQLLESNYTLKNVAKYTVTVTNFTCNNPIINSKLFLFDMTGNIKANFNFNLNCSTDIVQGNLNTSNVPNLLISWSPLAVDEIDIEWAYIDNQSKLGKKLIELYGEGTFPFIYTVQSQYGHYNYSNSLESFLKSEKSISYSRLTVDGSRSSVEIPNTYNNGFIIFRTRTVKNNPVHGRVSCDWVYHNPTTNKMNISHKRLYKEFNKSLNWNFNLNFAEGGKWKENLSFYDGLNRNRQTVTNIATPDGETVMVEETFYDVEGRKAGIILPAPASGNAALTFQYGFNKNLSNQTYSHLDFNYNRTNYCVNLPGELSTSSGASRYYSPDNPDKNVFSWSTSNQLVNQFIPDAKKFPLTTIDYSADQLGKVTRQGGVGLQHQVGSGNETKYYYGKPSSQEELDKLFGTDVGYVEHYSKMMTVDPNGQATITYADMNGNTIATALAGDAKPQSAILNDNSGSVPINYDVMNNALLQRDIKGNKITGTANLIISGQQTANFIVDLKNAFYEDLECVNTSFCADCYYDIVIKVTEECGGLDIVKNYKNYSINQQLSAECQTNNQSHLSNLQETFTQVLGVGSYNVSVEISLSEDKIDEYVEAYVANDKCNPKLVDITQEYMDRLQIDLSCIKNCQECESKYGADNAANFRQTYIDVMTGMKVDGVEVSQTELYGMAEALRLKGLEECTNSFCAEMNDCFRKKQLMINDLGLNGQYGFQRTKVWTPFDPNEYEVSTTWDNDQKGERHSMPWLNSSFCWQSVTGQQVGPSTLTDNNPWILINWGELKKVKAIVSQGKAVEDAWVEDYEIQYSTDGATFVDYTNPGSSNRKLFSANYDRNTEVFNKVYQDPSATEPVPLEAMAIKLFIKNWSNFQSIRLGVEFEQDNFMYNFKDHTSIYSPNNATYNLILSSPYIEEISLLMGRTPQTVEEVLGNWRPEFAEILLPLHPEYCDIEYCEAATADNYYVYENDLKNTNSYQEAITKGFVPSNGASVGSMFSNDPLYSFYPNQINAHKNSFNFFANQSITNPSTTNEHTIADWAVAMSKTTEYPNNGLFWLDITLNPLGSAKYCDAEKDMQWQMLRNIYLSIRQEIYESNNFCMDYSYIGCAGSAVSGDKTLVDVSDMAVENLCDEFDFDNIASFSGRYQAEYFKKVKHFPKSSKQRDATYDQLSNTGYNKTYGSTKSVEMGRNLCTSFKNQWHESLEQNCDLYQSQTEEIKEKILSDFVEVCANSVDGEHPNGATTLAKDKIAMIPANNQPIGIPLLFPVRSFMEAMTYRITNSIAPHISCDVNSLFPSQKPYFEQSIKQKVNTVSTQIPDCNCERINAEKRISGTATTQEFQNYLVNKYADEYCLTLDNLQDILDNCEFVITTQDDENGIPTIVKERVCPYLKSQYVLPYAFTCGFENEILVDCELLKILKNKYYYENEVKYQSQLNITGLYPYRTLDHQTAFYQSTMPMNMGALNSTTRPNPVPANLNEEEQYLLIQYFNEYFGVNYEQEFWLDYMTENCNCYHEDLNEFTVLEYEYMMEYKKQNGNPDPDRSIVSDFNEWLTAKKGVATNQINPVKYWYFSPMRMYYNFPFDACSSFSEDVLQSILNNTDGHPELTINTKYGTSFSAADLIGFMNSTINTTQSHTDFYPNYGYFTTLVLCLNPAIKSTIWDICFNNYRTLTGVPSVDEATFNSWSLDIGGYIPTICGGSSVTFPLNVKNPMPGIVNQTLTTSNYISWMSSHYTDLCQNNPNISNSCDVKLSLKPHYPCEITPIIDPCIEDMLTLTRTAILSEYEKQKMASKELFRARYIASCMKQADLNINFQGETNEKQYTLYYYDKRGNLIKTVPPAGVKPFTTQADIAAVKTARDNNGTPKVPDHKMPTEYHYNHRNLLISQSSPDGGTTNFWYDDNNRLVLSQNAKQRNSNYAAPYSYTLYDKRDRVLESGEFKIPNISTNSHYIKYSDLENLVYNVATDYRNIVRTFYDKVDPLFSTYTNSYLQTNLVNRIAHICVQEYASYRSNFSYDAAIHYSYDVLGNVNRISNEINSNGIRDDLKIKTIEYDYDLQSGKVNKVSYQKNDLDQFYYKYSYDDNFKLNKVETSYDNIIWQTDALYYYYKHGPLARVEYGDKKVQGMDYAYTLQGWLKAINSSTLDPNYDMGRDGIVFGGAHTNGSIARDAIALTLQYSQSANKDYDQIGRTSDRLDANLPTGLVNNDLYNGNISSSIVSLKGLSNKTMAYKYQYDQLNRLKTMSAYKPVSSPVLGNNLTAANLTSDYAESFNYDANGNIINLMRNKDLGTIMDQLSYQYYYYPAGSTTPSTYDPSSPPSFASGDKLTNQLAQVQDAVGPGVHTTDIDHQSNPDNYVYDAIGNLIEDKGEQLTITWNLLGKIDQIVNSKTGNIIKYDYDPLGNRIMKTVTPIGSLGDIITTVYARDAQGNSLGVYEQKFIQNSSGIGGHLGDATWKEQYLYGSSRLGTFLPNLNLTNPGTYNHYLTGKKQYELTNHLGNVLATIKDERTQVEAPSAPGFIEYYEPIVLTATDYYPFGMPMPNRQYSLSSSSYRFGFNGQEKDNEVYGEGNGLSFRERFLDPRIGRWFSTDPKKQFIASQYLAFANNPILFNDPDGGWVPGITNKGQITLTAEKGDNSATLRSFFGNNANAKRFLTNNDFNGNRKFGVGMNVILNESNVYSKAVKDAHDNPKKYDGKNSNYNCHMTLSGAKDVEFHNQKASQKELDNNVETRDETIKNEYTPSTPENSIVGESAVTYGEHHTAVFFGQSNDGTSYVFTKSGQYNAPYITKAVSLTGGRNHGQQGESYGPVRNIDNKNTARPNVSPTSGRRVLGNSNGQRTVENQGYYNKKK